MNIYQAIEDIITYAEIHLYADYLDHEYFRNAVFNLLNLHVDGEYSHSDEDAIASLDVPDSVANPIVDYAIEQGVVEDIDRELFKTALMGIFTPRPSEITATFDCLPTEEATRYLYDMGIKSDYIKLTSIKKNKYWVYPTSKCDLEITINLSKPEKDNREIARLRTAPQSGYPKCMLCKENINYQGRVGFPARQTLRYVPITLNGENFYMQYSPYLYFDEHCIIFSEEHSPMTMNRATFERLVDFTRIFPSYIAGSNACIPIVGGSILSHEHYQGGGHLMPVHYTEAECEYSHPLYSDVKVYKQDWFNTDVRLVSDDPVKLVDVAEYIFNAWQGYSDESVGVIAKTSDIHNAITPIARRIGDSYTLDLLLRNNRTDERYPDGIFHAHPEYHNIKKEGIGLIEAMGLFILPGRLDKELALVKQYLKGERVDVDYTLEDNVLYKHKDMIDELLARYPIPLNEDEADRVVKEYVGEVCKNILDNTAVFKSDEAGKIAFDKFMSSMGFSKI